MGHAQNQLNAGNALHGHPGLHGRVDKNHTCYYGVPDYRFETTPLTLKDLEEFSIRFREEQDNGEGQDK